MLIKKNDLSDLKEKNIVPDKSEIEIEQKLIQSNNFAPKSPTFSIEIPILLFYNQINVENLDIKTLFSKNLIFYSFNSQKMTKYLQKCLINASKEIITLIIHELKGTFREIIKNKNGNYFCSNLIKICDKNNRIKILKELSNSINEDCIDEFGTYPIQNLIQYASSEDEFQLLLSSFNECYKILMPAINAHGTFVIQKLIANIPEKSRTKFNSIFVKFICLLSRDIYGAFALEKFISHTSDEKIQMEILNSILNDFIKISTHKSGNYIIQSILTKWWDNEKGRNIKQMIKSKYSILSKNIYSAHICQLYDKLNNSEENI